jgi:type I restriction enzyme, S subunit
MSLPPNWRLMSLGELDAYVTSGSRGWAEYYADEGDNFIRITNLRRDKIDLDFTDMKYVALPKASQEGLRTRLKEGDILVSITADLGIVGFIRHEPKKASYINQHIALTRVANPEIYNEFVAYQLTSPTVQKRIQRLNDSGSKAGLSLDSIRDVEIELPPLNEQKKIAEILSTNCGNTRIPKGNESRHF